MSLTARYLAGPFMTVSSNILFILVLELKGQNYYEICIILGKFEEDCASSEKTI